MEGPSWVSGFSGSKEQRMIKMLTGKEERSNGHCEGEGENRKN